MFIRREFHYFGAHAEKLRSPSRVDKQKNWHWRWKSRIVSDFFAVPDSLVYPYIQTVDATLASLSIIFEI